MSRADRLTLNAAGLAMPGVDHLSNNGILNVLLDKTVAGLPDNLTSDYSTVGLFTNFVRLTDKALREYDAARAELLAYVEPRTMMATSMYLRAIDHMENCIGATHRAILNARALREQKVDPRSAPKFTRHQEDRLAYVRHAIEHSDEKVMGKSFRRSPPFVRGEPFSLRLANRHIVIGGLDLRYAELVGAMSKSHAIVEAIRGVPTGMPGPNFPNSALRTSVPRRVPNAGAFAPSEYMKELARLSATH